MFANIFWKIQSNFDCEYEGIKVSGVRGYEYPGYEGMSIPDIYIYLAMRDMGYLFF